MNLNNYIQGLRNGRDINFLEREAMQDSFLADALEGYDTVKGNHPERIGEMQKQVSLKTHPKNNTLRNWSIAAAVLVLLASGAYFLWDKYSFSISIGDYLTVQEEHQIPVSNALHLPVTEKKDSNIASGFRFDSTDSLLKLNVAESIPEDTILPNPSVTNEDVPDQDKEADLKNKPSLPRPAVGYTEYYNYLRTKLVRPAGEECKDVKGRVTLTFSINGNGRPENIRVLHSLCSSADAEAIRLVKEGPGWTAGETDVTVNVNF